jgi:hypothetical protein
LDQGAPLLDSAIDSAIDQDIDQDIDPSKDLLDPAAGFDRFGVTLVPGGVAIDR